MRYRLVIFDLDGTILNTIDDLSDSMNFILRKFDYPEHTTEECKYFVGNGIRKLIERAFPEGTADKILEKAFSEFVEYYREHAAIKTAPYNGMIECISSLKKAGIKIAVNTNKDEAAAVSLCNNYFPNLIDFVSGNRSGIPVKPDPSGVKIILQKYTVPLTEVCFVGDSDVDIQTGKNAGVDSIGVDWGFRGKEFLIQHGASKVVMTPDELCKVLLNA